MNQDIIKGKWKEIKGEIQRSWGNLTGDDLEKTKGDMKAIAGLVQQKYGIAQDEASAKVSEIYGRFHETRSDLEKIAADTTERTKKGLKQ